MGLPPLLTSHKHNNESAPTCTPPRSAEGPRSVSGLVQDERGFVPAQTAQKRECMNVEITDTDPGRNHFSRVLSVFGWCCRTSGVEGDIRRTASRLRDGSRRPQRDTITLR